MLLVPRMKSLCFDGRGLSCARGHIMALFVLLFSNLEFKGQCNAIELTASANSTSICNGGQLNLNSTISGLSGNPTVNYSWSGPNSFTNNTSDPNQFVVTAAAAGEYTVTATVSGCPTPIEASVIIGVLPLPAAPNFNLPATGCPGVSIATGLTPINGVNYNWTFSDNDGSFINGPNGGSVFFESGGSYTVTSIATSSNGCVSSSTDIITITELDVFPPDVALNGIYLDTTVFNGIITYQVCDGTSSGTVDITNYTATNNPATNYTIQWGSLPVVDFNDIITQSVSIGDNFLTVTATYNFCTISEDFSVYIGSNPFVSVGVGNSINLCPGDSVAASITPVADGQLNSPGTTYDLYFSDNPNTVVQSFTDLTAITTADAFIFNESSCGVGVSNACFPNQPNVFYAYVVATNACNTSCASSPAITYNSPPEANFSLSADTVCVNSSVTIENTGETGNTTTGSATTGFTCSETSKIKYSIIPNTGFTIQAPGSLGGTSGNYNNWTGTDIVVLTFNTPGTYTISQFAQANSCGPDTITQTICVESPPSVAITAAPLQGCAPLNVNVTNNSIDNSCAVTRLWTSIQTSSGCLPQPGAPTITSPTSLDPNVVFEEAGVYTIRLTMTNSCGAYNDTVQGITVKKMPEVTLPIYPSICAGQSCVSPIASYQNCGANISAYSWSFAGGSPLNSNQQVPGQVCYETPGTYTITANATNECGVGTASSSLTVSTLPSVILGNDTVVCNGSQVPLNAIVNGGTGPYTYLWTPTGSGLSSTNVEDVVATPTSTVEYFLQATDLAGCTKRDSITVTVNQPATAEVPDYTTCTGSLINIEVTSNNIGSWTQSPNNSGAFGNGSASTTTFTPFPNTAGSVTLRWTTIDPPGPCPQFFDEGTVTIVPPPQASFSNSFQGCSGGPINISVNTNTAGAWTTTNGGGSFNPPNAAISTYTPILSDAAIDVNLVWTTIDPVGP